MRLGLGEDRPCARPALPPPSLDVGERGKTPSRAAPPRSPRPARFPGAAGLTAFSCSSRSFILVPRRPEAGERVPGERPEVAAGPGQDGGAGGGGRRPRARRSVRGHWRLRRAALSGPAGAAYSKSGSRAGAGAQR